MRLSAHCYAVTGLAYVPPWSVNAGFVVGQERTLIIDTGANAAAAQTIHGYAGSTRPSNRLMVINTEKHFDHLGGNGYFRQRGLDVYGHASAHRSPGEFRAEVEEFAGLIANPVRRARHEEAVFYHASPLSNPNCIIDDEQAFDLGQCTAQILFTPGHTPSNISIYVPEDGVLYCGDCLTSGYLPNLDCGTPRDWQEWLRSLDQVQELAPTAIVPGHGPVAIGEEAPRIIERVRGAIEDAIRSAS